MPASETRGLPLALPPPAAVPAASAAPAPAPPRAAALHKAGLPQLYDPGLATTQACKSAITLVHGASGTLRYRGHALEDLVARASFDEVCHLLLHGSLPTRPQLAAFRALLAHPDASTVPDPVRRVVAAFPHDAHPMPVLCAALNALAAAHPDLDPAVSGTGVYNARAAADRAVELVLAQFPALLALIHAHTTGGRVDAALTAPRAGASYAESFLTRVRAARGEPAGASVVSDDAALLDTLLLLHADHEQNCSTSAVRHVSSAGASLFSSLAAGAAALAGPLHGGAAEAVIGQLRDIGEPTRIPAFLAAVRAGRARLMGFGHRVYRAADPRARVLRARATALATARANGGAGGVDGKLLAVALALERAARADDYFVSRELFPNVDFYSGLVYTALGFQPQFFTPLFALGRVAGWLAHWKEFLTDSDRRIVRPRQWYTGPDGPVPVPRIEHRVRDVNGRGAAKL